MPIKPSKRFGSKLESKHIQRRYLAVMGQRVRRYDYKIGCGTESPSDLSVG